MAKETISALCIQPETDDPNQEAHDLTNAVKKCIQDIAAPQCLNVCSYNEFIAAVFPEPREPSEHAAKKKAKKNEELHFWSGWIPWIKKQLSLGDEEWNLYQRKKRRMEEDTDEIYAREYAEYSQKLRKCHEKQSVLLERINQKDGEVIGDYFRYVLENDQFSIDYFNNYQVGVDYLQFDAEKEELQVCYRIPSSDEILPLDYFFYDENKNAIRDKQLSSGIAVQFRMDVARRVLLRAAATLFLSDENNFAKQIQIHGYLTDEADSGRYITVIKLVFPRGILNSSPEFINMKTDFPVLYAEEHSVDLYKVEAYQLRELLSRPQIRKNITPHNQAEQKVRKSVTVAHRSNPKKP